MGLKLLPPEADLETKQVLRQTARAHRTLGELKGLAQTMPNKNILVNAVMVSEAKDSSAIENIITTHDELFNALAQTGYPNPAAKEVAANRNALWKGYGQVTKRELLTINMMIDIQATIEPNKAGIRKIPGANLVNDATGEVVYTPPSGEQVILELLSNLEKYINDDRDTIDHLIKLAVIHYQFECIHPFSDGNGRTGRIINLLYLVLKELLDSPILYLSRYIIRTKAAYYRLLQEVTATGQWEDWILYILEGVEQTSIETMELIKRINYTVDAVSADIKQRLPKIYSKELVDLLFFELYTKRVYIERGLGVTRITATSYLKSLEKEGFLKAEKVGREILYRNPALMKVIRTAAEET